MAFELLCRGLIWPFTPVAEAGVFLDIPWNTHYLAPKKISYTYSSSSQACQPHNGPSPGIQRPRPAHGRSVACSQPSTAQLLV